MAKQKWVYFCKNCGYDTAKWFGKCPSCGEWNTCTEAPQLAPKREKSSATASRAWGETSLQAIKITDIEVRDEERIDSSIGELNRVLGGGIVKGSVVLIGGEPGIGKSTLVLQMALGIRRKVLYASGEESVMQLKMRAERIPLHGSECYTLATTSVDEILNSASELQPDILIVDSIQTIASESLDSSAGSIGQVKECTSRLLRYAKESGIPCFIIGHINKEGDIAGPKILEHIVDTVLQFEGDRHYMYRILRAQKNRFGNTSELGIFEMRQDGLREVLNPSEMLLPSTGEEMSGVAIAAMVEGIRPFLVEVQALVSSAVYGTPQRSATGFDIRRLNMLLAVLEKRAGFRLAQKDVFLNIAGGLRVSDPAADMAIAAAICSSNMDAALSTDTCLTGEIGLSGEIRPITRLEQRIGEAEKLGFKRILIPRVGKGVDLKKFTKIEIIQVRKVDEMIRMLFRG